MNLAGSSEVVWWNALPSEMRKGFHRQRSTSVFHVYVLFLILSGIAMLVLASVRSGQSPSRRVWNGILGAAFTGYGLYLLVIFKGGHYLIFYYVFILPVLMIVRFFRDRTMYQARQRAGAGAFQAPPPGYGPPGYGQQPGGYAQQPGDYGQQPGGYAQPSWDQPRE